MSAAVARKPAAAGRSVNAPLLAPRLQLTVGFADSSQTPSQRKDDRRNSAGARCEGMSTNRKLHADFFRRKPTPRRIFASGSLTFRAKS